MKTGTMALNADAGRTSNNTAPVSAAEHRHRTQPQRQLALADELAAVADRPGDRAGHETYGVRDVRRNRRIAKREQHRKGDQRAAAYDGVHGSGGKSGERDRDRLADAHLPRSLLTRRRLSAPGCAQVARSPRRLGAEALSHTTPWPRPTPNRAAHRLHRRSASHARIVTGPPRWPQSVWWHCSSASPARSCSRRIRQGRRSAPPSRFAVGLRRNSPRPTSSARQRSSEKPPSSSWPAFECRRTPFEIVAASLGDDDSVLLDSAGRQIAAYPDKILLHGRSAGSVYPYLAAAERGGTAISGTGRIAGRRHRRHGRRRAVRQAAMGGACSTPTTRRPGSR